MICIVKLYKLYICEGFPASRTSPSSVLSTLLKKLNYMLSVFWVPEMELVPDVYFLQSYNPTILTRLTCHQNNMVLVLQMRTQGSESLTDLFELLQLGKCKAWTDVGENVPDWETQDQACTWSPISLIPCAAIRKPCSPPGFELQALTLVKMISRLLP